MPGNYKRGWKGKGAAVGLQDTDSLACTLHFGSILMDADLWTACPSPVDFQSTTGQCVPLHMAGHQVQPWMRWLCTAVDQEPEICMCFSNELSKEQRAGVHKVVQQEFDMQLETLSAGVGQNRTISIYKKGHAPRLITEEMQAQALQLYKFARSQVLCMDMSVDEMTERLATNNLTEELQEAHTCMSHYVSVLDSLALAVAADDATAVDDIATHHEDIITGGITHPITGCLPLQEAARAGKLQALRALLAAGAPLEAMDAHDRTALQVARQAEETDAEAVLCQAGAHDPDAHLFPLTAAAANLAMS